MSNISSAVLSLCLSLLLLSSAQSQGPAPAPLSSPDCAAALHSLSACSTYVEAGSNLTRPKKGCCSGLAVVVSAEPGCLCRLIDDYGGFGVRIDTTRVLMLPIVCRVDAPPANLCAAPAAVGFAIASLPPSGGGPEEAGSSAWAAPVAAPWSSDDGGSRLGEAPMALFLVLLSAAAAAAAAV